MRRLEAAGWLSDRRASRWPTERSSWAWRSRIRRLSSANTSNCDRYTGYIPIRYMSPQAVGQVEAAALLLEAIRRSGGRLGGGCLRGGREARSDVVALVICFTARSKASSVAGDVDCTPLTLRTYWRAAASISSGVATGSSPRSVVMCGTSRHPMPGPNGARGCRSPPGVTRTVTRGPVRAFCTSSRSLPRADVPGSGRAGAVAVPVVDPGRHEDERRCMEAVIGHVRHIEHVGLRREGELQRRPCHRLGIDGRAPGRSSGGARRPSPAIRRHCPSGRRSTSRTSRSIPPGRRRAPR